MTSDSGSNRLGLSYRQEASRLPWRSPIWDAHVHLRDIRAAAAFFEVADLFGIERIWSMTNLGEIDDIRAEYGDRVSFIAVPNYDRRDEPETFTSDWLNRIERFAAKGVRICKFWGAPRGLDYDAELRLDSPTQRKAMSLATSLGMMLMVHVADPDIWFATRYADSGRYGTKAEHYARWRRLLEEHHDTPWLAAHMAGDPEHLDHVQELLDDYEHLHVDTAAAKWMVRELSRRPDEFGRFCRRNPGRVLFGTDIVASVENADFDLFASRYWALRTLLETDYDGPSPIVDPDLSLADPSLPEDTTADLRGARLDPATLATMYRKAAEDLLTDYR